MKTNTKYLNFSIISIFLILILLSAYGFAAFNIQLFGDDWILVVNPNDMDGWVGRLGRWGQFFYRKIFLIDTTFPPSATLIIALFLLCISAFIFILILTNKQQKNINVIYFCALFVLCPILINVFNFKLIRIPFAFGVLIIMLTIYYVREITVIHNKEKIKKLIFIGIGLSFILMIAISIRQSLLLVYLAVVQIIIISTLFNNRKDQGSIKYAAMLISLTFTSLIIYILVHKFFLTIFKLAPINVKVYSMEASLISSPSQLLTNLLQVWNQLKKYFYQGSDYWPLITKQLFIASYILYLFISITYFIKNKKRWLNIVFFILLNFSLLITPFLLGVVRGSEIPGKYKETSLGTLMVFYPVIYLFLSQFLINKKHKIMLHIVFGYIIVIWVFQINASSLVQHYINQRDLLLFNKITSRIESNENFKSYDGLTIAYLGKIKDYPIEGNKVFSSNKGMIHCGIFNCQIGRVKKLHQLTEYHAIKKPNVLTIKADISRLINRLDKRGVQYDKNKLLDEYAKMDAWPSFDSVNVVGNIAIIKLSD